MKLAKPVNEHEAEPELISKEKKERPEYDIKNASSEIERIGDRIVKVQFIEYIGKRKKKVTHIEVKENELEEMMDKNGKRIHAQFTLF